MNPIDILKQTSYIDNASPNTILINYLETRTSRGMLSKGWYSNNGRLLLVKGSNDKCGFEPQSEVLVSNLLSLLDIEHVKYWLEDSSKYPEIKSYGNKYVSVCESYKNDDIIETIPFCKYVDVMASIRGKNHVSDYWGELLRLDNKLVQDTCLMLHIDAIVGNQDRHLNNWEFLRMTDNSIIMSPLFDFGASLLAWDTIVSNKNNNSISPDKSKPFKSTHNEQIKLISRVYTSTLDLTDVFEEWVDVSKQVLDTLSISRKEAVCRYLYNRLEAYGSVYNKMER